MPMTSAELEAKSTELFQKIAAEIDALEKAKGFGYAGMIRVLVNALAISIHADQHCSEIGQQVRLLASGAAGIIAVVAKLGAGRENEVVADVERIRQIAVEGAKELLLAAKGDEADAANPCTQAKDVTPHVLH